MNRALKQQLKNRQELLEQAPPPAGGIVLGQAPSKEQQQKMMQAQVDQHCVMVAQGIYNQVVSNMLSTQDPNIQPLTNEKMIWLAEQCKGAAPYILQSFGLCGIREQLPSENMETEVPQAENEQAEPGKLIVE